MQTGGGLLDAYVLAMLDLLAREAPAQRFEELLRQAADAGVDGTDLAQLTQAKDRSLEVRQLFARRQQREAGLSALVDTARDLTHPYSLDTLLAVITRRARLLMGLDMSWVSLHGDDGASEVRAADGHASAITVGFEVPFAGGVGAHAQKRSAPFWTPDYLHDDSFVHSETIDHVVRSEGLRAIMAVPLRHEHSTLGVLYVADRNIRHFLPNEISLMASLADLAAVAIERTRLLERTRTEVAELAGDVSQAMDSSAAVRRLHSVHRGLIDLALGGSDLTALLERAAAELGGPLLVRGAIGKDLACTENFPDFLSGTESTRIDNRTDGSPLDRLCLDAQAAEGPVRCDDGTGGVLSACPVTGGTESLGTLLLHGARPPSETQEQLLGLVAQAVAVQLLMQRSSAVAEGQVRDELLHDLLHVSQLPPTQLAARGRRLGVDLAEPHVVVVVRPEGGSQSRANAWASACAHRLSGLKYVDGGHIVLLLPGDDPSGAARSVQRELSVVLGHPVTGGAAGPTTAPDDVRRVHQEARRCLEALTVLEGVGGTASPKELGFLGLLLSEKQDVERFVRSAVGPVLDYDHQQSTELLRTLESYFTSGSSPTRAAELLHVHPNTVSRRLERITDLLGSDWQEPAQALEVQLALRLHRTRHLLGGG
ncbi:sugar diacid utilization regulator [Streptomyces sp. TLI_55]|uniref:helix-turn-helix domain-containing protein n=1 Tax=Streptomyces sp. TLI_55 TaxID=1938861 RepID=UPI000BD638AF|nr:helix-turn-helix domain-containing protein [Streptomyces sp. TLI_55]SNX62489.1 sugar diacid utilization regulator [Streptomyces sp. TLI_55]